MISTVFILFAHQSVSAGSRALVLQFSKAKAHTKKGVQTGKQYLVFTSSNGFDSGRVFDYFEKDGKFAMLSGTFKWPPKTKGGEAVTITWSDKTKSRMFIATDRGIVQYRISHHDDNAQVGWNARGAVGDFDKLPRIVRHETRRRLGLLTDVERQTEAERHRKAIEMLGQAAVDIINSQ